MQIMTSLLALALQLLPIVVFFGAGIAVRQLLLRQWQGDAGRLRDFQRGLSIVLMEVLLPAIAFLSMARVPVDTLAGNPWRLAWVPVLGLLTALLALLTNHALLAALPAALRPSADQRQVLDMMAAWSNTVTIGLPVVATLLGSEQLYVPFLETSFVWTLILGPLIIRGAAQPAVLWAALRPLLRSLWFWTIPLGLLWAIFDLPLSGVGLAILERTREAFLVIGLLVVGLGFDATLLRPRQIRRLPGLAIMISGAVKLLLCPLLALLMTLPLGLPRGVPAALALTVATPSSITAYIISEREGLDAGFMSVVFALYSALFFGSALVVHSLLLPLFPN
jgi:predicted permease